MNLSRAEIYSEPAVEQMIHADFAGFAREADEIYALVYLVESNAPEGTPVPGFRPGYVALVWPAAASVSQNWLAGGLSDGTDFCFLPRERWGEGGTFRLDMEQVTPTYSLVRQLGRRCGPLRIW
jgi:hypothetical protein